MEKFKFVIIGGYAVNAYTLPRFSVDCDIVVKDREELKEIEDVLVDFGYVKEENNKDKTSYYGDFLRLEKDMGNNVKVSIDILIKEVLDRQTNATFSANWVFDNSEIRTLRGKTIIEELLQDRRISHLSVLIEKYPNKFSLEQTSQYNKLVQEDKNLYNALKIFGVACFVLFVISTKNNCVPVW